MKRCNKCYRPMNGTTGYDGACACGGLIEMVPVHPGHPHPDKMHVRRCYRGHLLACKRKYGSARSLIHRRKLIETYLWTKQT